MYYNSVVDLIGNTPIVKLNKIIQSKALDFNVFAKLEYLNPSGSAKDRAALYMIKNAEKSGKLKPGGVIIEPTSGNTGIGIAAISASLGYKSVFVMPDTMSEERRKFLKIYGAEIVLTPGNLGMSGAVQKAKELSEKTPNSIVLGQFENPDNSLAHFETTGPEILDSLGNELDAFVCGVGTGGTIMGTARYLKSKSDKIKIIAVEPKSSPFLSKGISGSHGLQGIGAGFKPDILDETVYDEIICVDDNDAVSSAKEIAEKEGYLVGITSGAALWAAINIAKQKGFKNILALFPDSGDRYLSTPMFD